MSDIDNKYRDNSHIQKDNEIEQDIEQGTVDNHSSTLAKWLREKMYGVDVRESLALFVEFLSTKYNDLIDRFSDLSNKESTLEDRQNELDNEFKNVIAGSSEDDEVINSRNSDNFGEFKVLDDRLENDESKLIELCFDNTNKLEIKHDLGYHPTVKTYYYENAIGTHGFLQNTEVFGSTKLINKDVMYETSKQLSIALPITYQLNGELDESEMYDNTWYLTEENEKESKTIKIELRKEA